MKLIFELLTVILLFLLFRGAVQRFLPKRAQMESFSEESVMALRRFRIRYFLLLILFIGIFGTVLFFALVGLKNNTPLSANANWHYLKLKDSALWQPALLGGLLIGSLLAYWLNRRLQKDGLSFYLEELQELAQGYQSFGMFRKIQYIVGLVLFTILSYSVLATSLTFSEDKMYQSRPFKEKVAYSLEDIKKLDGPKATQLLINQQDTINMALYEYNSETLKSIFSE